MLSLGKTNLLSLLVLTCMIGNELKAQHMNDPNAPCQIAGPMSEKTACFISASQKADAELNHVYQVVLTVVEGTELKDLRSTQRLWIQFRDSNCSAERELYYAGSAAPTVYYACVEAMTRHRIAELKTMYGWRVEKWDKKF